MPKSLADGHSKFTILTEEPGNPDAPTVAELTAGIDMECNILASDFTWTATDSDKVAERALCDTENANALGPSNFTAGFTVFRKFDATTGAVDETEDEAYQVAKAKGTSLWGYHRKNGKLATAAWAAGDEILLGMEILTDNPQEPSDGGGYIKRRIPAEPQQGWLDIEAAA
jgi:hypothetical protein